MGAVGEQHAGTASGINNAVSRIAGMLAVALLGAIAAGVFATALDARLADLQVPDELRHALEAEVPKLAEATVPSGITGETRAMLERALDEAFVHSFRIVMLVSAALALASALCAALTIGGSQKPRHRR
jgi:hypothetical protein